MSSLSCKRTFSFVLLVAIFKSGVSLRSFAPVSTIRYASSPSTPIFVREASSGDHSTAGSCEKKTEDSNARRSLLLSSAGLATFTLLSDAPEVLAAADNLKLVEEARRQLDPVPKLIDAQKWDSVRAILITPPLSDCWSKSASMLRTYAESVDDELAALEAREDAVTHLRFLDMAVYNNVFNPIATEGAAGATKELVSSYYEDPINEWKASVAALDELIQLGK